MFSDNLEIKIKRNKCLQQHNTGSVFLVTITSLDPKNHWKTKTRTVQIELSLKGRQFGLHKELQRKTTKGT